jgi:hypothetical protein
MYASMTFVRSFPSAVKHDDARLVHDVPDDTNARTQRRGPLVAAQAAQQLRCIVR